MGRYYKRPDGLYEAIRVINGKRIAFRGRTVSEVERKMRGYKEKADKTPAFDEIADLWWEELEPTLAYNTTKSYIPALERAKAEFQGEEIGSITVHEISDFITHFSRQGRSQKNVTTQLQIIRQICDYAAKKGIIPANPAKSVQIPRGLPKNHRLPPTPEEIQIIKENAKKHLLPALIYYTGARIGEALALRWEDFDFSRKLIRIERSVYYVSTRPEIKEPKTESGKRKVPLLGALESALPKVKKRGYIFSPDNGKTLLWESQARHLFDLFQKETGVTATAHQIRHGYATALLEAGVEAKVAQKLLGHAQISTTLDIYTHVRDSMIADAASKMENSF